MRIDRGRGAVARLAGLLLVLAVFAPAQTGTPGLLNRKAPEFARRALNGQSIGLAQSHGKVTLLNFWATWCAPCQIEMPTFEKWQGQYGAQGFAVVGISMDDDDASVRKIVQKLRITYPIAMGDVALGKRYGGVLGLPETFLIDRNGIVRAKFQGEADLKKIEASIQQQLASR